MTTKDILRAVQRELVGWGVEFRPTELYIPLNSKVRAYILYDQSTGCLVMEVNREYCLHRLNRDTSRVVVWEHPLADPKVFDILQRRLRTLPLHLAEIDPGLYQVG